MPTNIWNQTHEQRSIEYDRPWYRSAESLLSSVDANHCAIVEIGCGNGEFSAIVDRWAARREYVGLDGHFPSLTKAKISGCRVIQTDFEQVLPLRSACADIVIALEVIEHIATAESLLSELRRILKPNGYLIISTPNIGYFAFRMQHLFRGEIPGEGVHLRFFNRSTLEQKLTEAGFDLLVRKSIVPFIGYNRLMRLMRRQRPKFIFVPNRIEGLMALDLVWLLQRVDGL